MRGAVKRWAGALAALSIGLSVASAHPGHETLAVAQREPAGGAESSRGQAPASSLKNEVEITTKDGYRYITANGIPNHPTGQFPNPNNPGRIAAQEYRFRVTLEPKANDKPTSIRHDLFGVAVNGVPFDPGTAEFWNNDRGSRWNYEALTGHLDLGVDRNRAHVQPGGVYHYHGVPTGLIEVLSKRDGAAKPSGDAKRKDDAPAAMLLLGYAADGFPIYGPFAHAEANDAKSALQKMKSSYRLKKGQRPAGNEGPGGTYDGTFTADFEYAAGAGDLDECNGRSGVTSEYPKGTYYYVLTEEFPFVPRFWRGTPDESFRKQGGPRGAGGPGGRGGGPAEPGGRRPPPPRDGGGPRGDAPPPPPPP